MEHTSSNWTEKRQKMLDVIVEQGAHPDSETLRRIVHACALVSSEMSEENKKKNPPKESVWKIEVSSWEQLDEAMNNNEVDVEVGMKTYAGMIKDATRFLKKGKASTKTLQAISEEGGKKRKTKKGGASQSSSEPAAALVVEDEKKQDHKSNAKKGGGGGVKKTAPVSSDVEQKQNHKSNAKKVGGGRGGRVKKDTPVSSEAEEEEEEAEEKENKGQRTMVLRKSTRDRTATRNSAYYWTEPIAKQILATRTKKRKGGAQTKMDRPWTFAEIETAWRKDAYAYVKLPDLVATLKNQGLYKE